MWFGRHVTKDDAVHHKLSIVGRIAKVTSVGQVAFTGLEVVVVERLVNPVPDGTTAEEVGALNGIPVVHQVAHRITHGVCILGDMEGVLDFVVTLHGTPSPSDGGILVGAHIYNVVVAFILHGARSVESLNGLVGSYKVLTRSGFVAQRPNHDGGTVDGAVHHLHVACHVCVAPLLRMRERCCTIVVFVRLQVGLILQIDTILITQVIPVGIVGIVGVTHVVDVGSLHHHHLFEHVLTRQCMSRLGSCFVAVHALQLHGLAVDVIVSTSQFELIVLSLSILDFHLAEAGVGRYGLHHLALLVLQLGHQGIAVRRLSTPLLGHLHRQRAGGALRESGLDIDGLRGKERILHLLVIIGVEGVGIETVGQCIALGIFLTQVADIGLDVKYTILVVVHQVGDNHQVANLHLGGRVECHGAEDTRQTEHILRFEERGIRTAIDLGSHHIGTRLEEAGNIEAGRIARVLREAHVTAVNPEVEERVHAIKADIDLTAIPLLRQFESAAIGAHLVAMLVGRPVGGGRTHHTTTPVIDSHLVLKDDGLIHVDRRSVTLAAILLQTSNVPTGRYSQVVPSSDIKVWLVEVSRTFIGVR